MQLFFRDQRKKEIAARLIQNFFKTYVKVVSWRRTFNTLDFRYSQQFLEFGIDGVSKEEILNKSYLNSRQLEVTELMLSTSFMGNFVKTQSLSSISGVLDSGDKPSSRRPSTAPESRQFLPDNIKGVEISNSIDKKEGKQGLLALDDAVGKCPPVNTTLHFVQPKPSVVSNYLDESILTITPHGIQAQVKSDPPIVPLVTISAGHKIYQGRLSGYDSPDDINMKRNDEITSFDSKKDKKMQFDETMKRFVFLLLLFLHCAVFVSV